MSSNQPAQHPMPVQTTEATREPTLAEDVLLLLFQPSSGTIAGETTLFYVLGGAVLADLAFAGVVETRRRGIFHRVHPIGETPPDDELFESTWASITTKPRNVQTVLAAVGPYLREPLLDRLVERGDLDRVRRFVLSFIPTTSLALGSDRRQRLLEPVRAALVDGDEPDERTAAIIALLSASNTLPQFDPEIPWSGDVYLRGKAFERGNWGAAAAASAVARTMAAIVANSVSTAIAQRSA